MNRTLFSVGLLWILFSLTGDAQRDKGDFYLRAKIANDVFYLPLKTDRYFTSGMEMEYGRPAPTKNHRWAKLRTIRYWRLNHHLYTPQAIDSLSLQTDDRPFASYLTVTRGQVDRADLLGLRLERSWTVGILGKYSGGGSMQNAFHAMVDFAAPVPGWKHEVRPDVVLNYLLRIARSFYPAPAVEVAPFATARLGTLYTDVAAGSMISVVPLRFSSAGFLKLSFRMETRLVGYNATLTGGLLNRDERYRGTIKPHRLVGRGEVLLALQWHRWQFSGGVNYLGKEFKAGQDHIWAWMEVRRGF